MSANHSTAAGKTGASRQRALLPVLPLWSWVLVALALGIALGGGIALVRGSSTTSPISSLAGRPAATWPAGAQHAPNFRLVDEHGAAISLARFHGRPVIVTFIDPVCRNLCPLEAKQLNSAVAATPAARRPVIVAVSVNPWANSPATFRQDRKKWHLVPQWHWAVGGYARTAPVWKSYKIGVLAKKKVIAGVTVHEIAHTEASYVVDRAGYERALFLYPFVGKDVATVLEQLPSPQT
ncbi:MAG TPA: SCO family protein [Gaiellaceae bacterium]|nr:SCO family protein [Gaiellaceae bacterium]